MRESTSIFFLALGGAVWGGFVGIFGGALVGALYGGWVGNVALGLDGAMLGGLALTVFGAVYGVSVGIVNRSDGAVESPAPEKPARHIAAPHADIQRFQDSAQAPSQMLQQH
jgi:hypothetical protein